LAATLRLRSGLVGWWPWGCPPLTRLRSTPLTSGRCAAPGGLGTALLTWVRPAVLVELPLSRTLLTLPGLVTLVRGAQLGGGLLAARHEPAVALGHPLVPRGRLCLTSCAGLGACPVDLAVTEAGAEGALPLGGAVLPVGVRGRVQAALRCGAALADSYAYAERAEADGAGAGPAAPAARRSAVAAAVGLPVVAQPGGDRRAGSGGDGAAGHQWACWMSQTTPTMMMTRAARAASRAFTSARMMASRWSAEEFAESLGESGL
jgi:hypothetical protein